MNITATTARYMCLTRARPRHFFQFCIDAAVPSGLNHTNDFNDAEQEGIGQN